MTKWQIFFDTLTSVCSAEDERSLFAFLLDQWTTLCYLCVFFVGIYKLLTANHWLTRCFHSSLLLTFLLCGHSGYFGRDVALLFPDYEIIRLTGHTILGIAAPLLVYAYAKLNFSAK